MNLFFHAVLHWIISLRLHQNNQISWQSSRCGEIAFAQLFSTTVWYKLIKAVLQDDLKTLIIHKIPQP